VHRAAELQLDIAAFGVDAIADTAAAMDLQTIPNDEEFAARRKGSIDDFLPSRALLYGYREARGCPPACRVGRHASELPLLARLELLV
jgi:hypothetical protein